VLVAGAVEEASRDDPPISPVVGACYIVGLSPTGAWTEKPQCVAAYTSGGWRFVAPIEGMSLFVKATSEWASFRGGAWETGTLRGASVVVGDEQVVGARLAAIASPGGGTTIDSEARLAIGQILVALRTHGLIES